MTTQVFQALTNTMHHKDKDKHKPGHTGKQPGKPHQQRQPKPDWFNHPPSTPDQVHTHGGREWRWCPKCGKDSQGKWVCTHLPQEHKDSFQRKRKPDDHHQQYKQARLTENPKARDGADNKAGPSQPPKPHSAHLVAQSDLLETPNGDITHAEAYPDDILDW
jgi:hypothetical protein